MFKLESMERVQKAITMPVYKNDAHNDVEVINLIFFHNPSTPKLV